MKTPDSHESDVTVLVPRRSVIWRLINRFLAIFRFLAISLAVVAIVTLLSWGILWTRLNLSANELAKVRQWPAGKLAGASIEYTLSTRWLWRPQPLGDEGSMQYQVTFRASEADLTALNLKLHETLAATEQSSIRIHLVDADMFTISTFGIESFTRLVDSDGSATALLAEGYLNDLKRKEYQSCKFIRIVATVR